MKVFFFEKASPLAKIEIPNLSQNLLKSKYRALKKGIDTLDYIKETIAIEKSKREEKEMVRQKFDYSTKQLIAGEADVDLY